MMKRIIGVSLCAVLMISAFLLTACTNEADALQARINTLETENTELQSTISDLRTDLERTKNILTNTQNDMQDLQAALQAAQEEQALLQGGQSVTLAITYGGEPNKDMSWPLTYGDLILGLIININDLDENDEIVWRTTNEDIFTVIPGEDGTTATVTPETVGSAELVVTVGDRETRSWVRITAS